MGNKVSTQAESELGSNNVSSTPSMMNGVTGMIKNVKKEATAAANAAAKAAEQATAAANSAMKNATVAQTNAQKAMGIVTNATGMPIEGAQAGGRRRKHKKAKKTRKSKGRK